MPVKKVVQPDTCDCGSGSCVCGSSFWSSYGMFGKKLVCTLLGILLVYVIILVGTMIRNNMREYSAIGKADKMERTITVEADGKVTVTPNIAITTMGMTAEGKTVAEAQQKNTDVMNTLIEKVKALGVDKADVQTTNYNIYPNYDYTDGRQTIRNYAVNQSVTIKIRDLAKANQILALAGEVGANNVSGLQFTVDDRDAYKEKARQEAFKKIAAKRDALSQSLGVKLRSIVTYNEYEVTGGYGADAYKYEGMGGSPAAANPGVETGSNDVVVHVTVVFEVQ